MKKIVSFVLFISLFFGASAQQKVNIYGANPRTSFSSNSPLVYDPNTGLFSRDSTLGTNTTVARLAASTSLLTGERRNLIDTGREGVIVPSTDQVTAPDNGIRFADGSGRIWERVDKTNPLITWWMASGVTDITAAWNAAKNLVPRITIPAGNYRITDSLHTGIIQDIYINGNITQAVADSGKHMFIADMANVHFQGYGRGRLYGSLGSGAGSYIGTRAGILSMYDNLWVEGLFIEKQTGVQTMNANGLRMVNDTLHASEMAIHAWANVGISKTGVYVTRCYGYIASRTAAFDNQERGFRTTNMKQVFMDNNDSYGFQLSFEYWASTTSPDSNISYSTRNYCINNRCDNYISMVAGVTTCSFNNLDYALRPANAAPVPTNSTLPVALEIGGTMGLVCVGNNISNFPGTGIFATTPASTYNGFPYAATRSYIAGNNLFNCGRSDHAEMPAITIGCGVNIEISGNIIKNENSSGISIVGITGLPQLTRDIDVHDNQVINAYYHCYYSGYATNVKFHDNLADSSVVGDGIRTGIAPDYNVEVKNNKTTRCVNGIYYNQTFGNSYVWGNTTYGNRTSNLRTFGTTGLVGNFKSNTAIPGPFLPEVGSWEIGMNYEVQSATNPTVVVLTAGTMGTLPTTTATTTSGSNQVVVSSKSPQVQPGQYVDIAGVTGTYKIVSISADSTVWTVGANASASVSGAATSWHAATFANPLLITSGADNIPGNKNFTGRTTFAKVIVSDTVNGAGPGIFLGDIRGGARFILPNFSSFAANITVPGGTSAVYFNNSNGLMLGLDSTTNVQNISKTHRDTTVSANYTASNSDYNIHVDGTAGAVQVTAPAYTTMIKSGPVVANRYAQTFIVSRNDASGNAVTVIPQGANKFIRGGDTVVVDYIQPGEVHTYNATGVGSTGYFKVGIQQGFSTRSGQTALVAGTKAITVNGVTTASIAVITLVSQSGTVTTTAQYRAVCTANTVTISAVTSAGTNTVNAADVSTVNYIIVN